LRALAWLALGAAVSVGSAWFGVLFRVYVDLALYGESWELVDRHWPIPVPPDWPTPYVTERSRGPAYERVTTIAMRTPGAVVTPAGVLPAEHFHAFRRRSGWPLMCMQSRFAERSEQTTAGVETRDLLTGKPVTERGQSVSWHSLWDRGIAPPFTARMAGGGAVRFTLPVRPLWPELALNTMAWAGGLWALVAGRRRVIERLRAAKGLCPGCAYELSDLHACPECGRRVRDPLTPPADDEVPSPQRADGPDRSAP
jgi:hypothetical protein